MVLVSIPIQLLMFNHRSKDLQYIERYFCFFFSDEGIKSIEHDSVRNFSPKSSKKSAAPPPPIPPKPVSIKVRQAPTINGAHTTALHT